MKLTSQYPILSKYMFLRIQPDEGNVMKEIKVFGKWAFYQRDSLNLK